MRSIPLNVAGALEGRNAVEYAGSLDTTGGAVQLNPHSGLFQTEDQIRRVIDRHLSLTGQPVYIGDCRRGAPGLQGSRIRHTLQRRARPDAGSVEMQEGNNIVDFGDSSAAQLEHVRARCCRRTSSIDFVADQPRVVEDRITHFIREFGIAIAAVILVTLLLLPFRVALIAALAIPVTVAVTFGVHERFRIELHQVSIAALIVVLGMVVDDAIVIADNYVELLDRGDAGEDAAWRSATELAVPVLTATLTIIASFLPLLMLSGCGRRVHPRRCRLPWP